MARDQAQRVYSRRHTAAYISQLKMSRFLFLWQQTEILLGYIKFTVTDLYSADMTQFVVFAFFAVLATCTAMNLRSKAHNKPPGLVKTAAVIEQNSPNCPSAFLQVFGELPAKCLTGPNAGHCIPHIFVCDNYNDCGDASDEDLSICPPKVCDLSNFVKCQGTNMCIIKDVVCDGYDHCGDNSDEQNCPGRSFVSKVKATSRHTSKMNLRSKAHNKPHGLVKTAAVIEQNSPDCPNGGAKCLSGEFAGRCIPSSYLCDNYNDCGDASDEDLSICPPNACSDSQTFQCPGTNVCITGSWVCDNWDDCGDDSDEQDCSQDSSDYSRRTEKALIKQALNKRSASMAKTAECPAFYTTCPDSSPEAGKCIPDDYLCDYWNDCGDGSDESVAYPSNCPKVTCESGEFDCAPINSCIPNIWICDGDNDCGNLSDEANCSPSKVKATTKHTSKKLHWRTE